MAIALLVQSDTEEEQRLLMPGTYTWQDFEALEFLLTDSVGVRLTYLDGVIELMTLGEAHELIKKSIAILLESYLIIMGIEFIPVGSATRRSADRKVSFEPDESYYLRGKKDNPDLAIEVNLTSGNLQKLEKYRRFGIPEVWIWETEQLKVYCLIDGAYQELPYSQLLPDLDIGLLARCVQIPSRLEAINAFRAGLNQE